MLDSEPSPAREARTLMRVSGTLVAAATTVRPHRKVGVSSSRPSSMAQSKSTSTPSRMKTMQPARIAHSRRGRTAMSRTATRRWSLTSSYWRNR